MQSRKHKVSRKRSVDGKTGCFHIPNFSNHDDIGVLPHKRTEAARKSEADFWLDLCLVYSLHLILDWIFYSRNVHIGSIQYIHHGVERCSFTGTGGTSGQYETARRLKCLMKTFESFTMKSKFFKCKTGSIFAENS